MRTLKPLLIPNPFLMLVLALCLGLVSCTSPDNEEGELSAEDQAKAAVLFESYESARQAENWQAAEASAEQLRDKYPGSDAAAKIAASFDHVQQQAELAREQRRLAELWDYQRVAVDKGVQRSASLYSRTPPVEEGMPAATPDAQLVLRDHPSWGLSSYLLFDASRFKCGQPCTMQISFDAGEPRRFAGKQADSGKGPALFIEDEQQFIEAMSKAKKLRIELPKGSGKIPVLVFEVGGYQPSRFESP